MIQRAALAALVLIAGSCVEPAPGYDTHPVVAATVGHVAPGVALGGGIERVSVQLRRRRWIPYLGALANPGHPAFAQIRLFPDHDVRARGEIEWSAPLRAVELVSTHLSQRERLLSEIQVAFGRHPSEGCARGPGPGDLRPAHFWVAPDSAGGVAVLGDFVQPPDSAIGSGVSGVSGVSGGSGGAVWRLWVWSGPLRNGETFPASLAIGPCGPAPARSGPQAGEPVHPTRAALQALDRAFRDSVIESAPAARR